MPDVPDPTKPVALKILYIKMVFLVDKKKHEGNPVFTRKLRRSGEEFPIYDSSIFYQFTQFGPNKPAHHKWEISKMNILNTATIMCVIELFVASKVKFGESDKLKAALEEIKATVEGT